MDAQGALDSLLGRLTTVLVNEAQLLGRVRGDVEFIKEEMECMNSLILQLTEAQFRDHLVRAWMKQVVGLTRDCEGNVELYIHYIGSKPCDGGLLGRLRRVVRFLQTIPVHHRLATRIQELKVRARDVGDRRQRYVVTVPESTRADMNVLDVEPLRGQEDLWRRGVLLYGAEPPPESKEADNTQIKWFYMEPAREDGAQSRVRVFYVSSTNEFAHEVAEYVYEDARYAPIFDFMASTWNWDCENVLHKILEEVRGVELQFQPGQKDKDREKQLISKIQGHLKGKRFLILLQDIEVWEQKCTLDALLHAAHGSLPGSAIIMTTMERELAPSSSPYKIIHARDPFMVRKVFKAKTDHLLGTYPTKIDDIFCQCDPDTFAMKTFLHLLYVNPNRREDELQKYGNEISECIRLNRSISKQVLLWCYNELPSKYRSCLLYLSVFPEGHVISTTSLARRWVAEGLITATSRSTLTDDEIQSSSTDEAEHCLDVLFTRGFVSPVEIYAADKIKSYTVHRQVREFITRIARDVNFVESNLPPHLARYLSIHNRIGLQHSLSEGDTTDIVAYLPSLAASSQWQLLKVLDLEGCKGLKKKHLKSICKILLLKYLSLRSTDVTELPKQIKELQCLETLDIRQTKVRMLAKKAIVLPMLKHFLAGHKISVSNDGRKFEEAFLAVDMPVGIQRMSNLEIVSHFQVTNSSSELTGIAKLLKLRKLGVALHGQNAKLSELFDQIVGLRKCLRSLSVRIHQEAVAEEHDALTPPNFITSLNISGLTSGLAHMIQQLHQLVKLTLAETLMKEDGLRILGKLRGLRFLRLQNNAYTESELSLKEEEFQTLNFLLVGTSDVTNTSFVKGAAPKLERIIWSFPTTACVSGLKHIRELRVFELNGDCNPDQVRDEVQSLAKSIMKSQQGRRFLTIPVFKHNPHVQRQDNRATAPASSSSAT